jgi:collagenase-like PrtC family protease
MQLTLGPVLYNWQPDDWRDFYFRIADEAEVDTVVLGETVCSKRAPFFERHLPEVAERLVHGGKHVLLGSLILISLPRERRQAAELATSGDFMVEANDLTCLRFLEGRPHAIGPYVNVYNEATAAYLAGRGAKRIALPLELPLSSIGTIAGAVKPLPIEVFAFGRGPLAISARCYHARLHGLTKDSCRFVCENDPDGLPVRTLDGTGFLAINGVQTLSYTCTDLLGATTALAGAGVAALRLSPQRCDMVGVARVFREVLDGRCTPAEGSRALSRLYPEAPPADGFVHGAPGAQRVS